MNTQPIVKVFATVDGFVTVITNVIELANELEIEPCQMKCVFSEWFLAFVGNTDKMALRNYHENIELCATLAQWKRKNVVNENNNRSRKLVHFLNI